MLVLERKVQEGFWIGDQIFVNVLDVGRGRVRIGIQAPSDMRILRDELLITDGHAAPVVEQPLMLDPTGTAAKL